MGISKRRKPKQSFAFTSLINLNFTANVNFKNSKEDMRPLYAGGSFVIAQEQDGKIGGGFFNKNQAFSGKATQIEMWDTVLTLEEIYDLAKCNKATTKAENRIVTWGSDLWTWHETNPNVDSPFEEFCIENYILDTEIWASKLSFDKLSYYCEIVGGRNSS